MQTPLVVPPIYESEVDDRHGVLGPVSTGEVAVNDESRLGGKKRKLYNFFES